MPISLLAGDHDYCREKCGVVLGRGIGDLQGRAFRIAHMGPVNAPMVLKAFMMWRSIKWRLLRPRTEGGARG
jgi:alanine-glyoxylate transaminase / serine-glyoxylate transaminase / serine-pyruvate transaminase